MSHMGAGHGQHRFWQREKRLLAMFEHGAGVGRGEAAQLGAEIKEDRVRFPMTQGMDGSLVDARDEKGGGTP